MNVICGFIEAITATIELIGMGVGSLSIIWSWCGGICGPIIGGSGSTIFDTFVSGIGLNAILTFCGSLATSVLGVPISQACGAIINGIYAAISSLIPM